MATNNQTSPIVIPRLRKDLRTAVEDVFHEMGGSEALLEWASQSTVNRRIFYKDILTKVIPKQIQGELSGTNGQPIKMVVEWSGSAPSSQPLLNGPASSVASDIISTMCIEHED